MSSNIVGNSLLEIKNLHTQFSTPSGVIKALNGVDLSIDKNQIVGLLGESGSGKSVFAYSILGMPRKPGKIVKGEVLLNGRNILTLREDKLEEIRRSEISLIVSNPKPKLNPLEKIGKQISNFYSIHSNASRIESLSKTIEILKAVGLNDPERRINSYPHELSGGMAQRVLIAMALITNPKFIIADDPTYGLDVTIQVQVLDLIRDMIRKNSSSAIIISHDLSILAQYCDKIAVMYAGKIVEESPTRNFFQSSRHPYSLSLLGSIRSSDGGNLKLPMLGLKLDLKNLPQGCHLHERCPLAENICKETTPDRIILNKDHYSSCHFAKEINKKMLYERFNKS